MSSNSPSSCSTTVHCAVWDHSFCVLCFSSLMSPPKAGRKAAKSSRNISRKEEALYSDAVAWLQADLNLLTNRKPQYKAALSKFPTLTYQTLCRCFLCIHHGHLVAHEKQMLLSLTEERTLVDWMSNEAMEAHPWSRLKLKTWVEELCGKRDLCPVIANRSYTCHPRCTLQLFPSSRSPFPRITTHSHS